MCRLPSSKIRFECCGWRASPRASRRWVFTVAPETLELMRAMVERGEVDALVAERVWQETEKALRESGASAFFRCCAIAAP